MKKIILSYVIGLMLIMQATQTRAQVAGTIQWQKTIGGDYYDFVYVVEQTSDGGYILGGSSQSPISGDKTEATNGGFDYWVIKIDSIGDIQWQNTIGGNSDEILHSIIQTSDGGYILGGASWSGISGDKTEANIGNRDFWILKLDSAGNILWQNTIGGTDVEELGQIIQTMDGGYLIGGKSNSMISGDKTENSIDYDYWVLKLDTIGNITWQNTIGGSDPDVLKKLAQSPDGGYLVAGYSESGVSGDKTEPTVGDIDYWVLKLDSTGTILWQNDIGGTADDYLYGLGKTTDGGFILGGYSLSSIGGDKTGNSRGGYDYWVVKIDSLGVVRWDNTFGGNDDDALLSIQQTADSGFIVGGQSLSPVSGDKTGINKGGNDDWILKLDSNGALEWQSTIGGDGEDAAKCVVQTSDGGYAIVGSSDSDASFDKTENSKGAYDFWVVKMCDGHAQSDTTISVVGVQLTSNCTSGNYQWYLNGSIVSGADQQSYTALQNGNYFVEITNESGCAVNSSTVVIYSVGIEQDLQASAISIFPNPASSFITISGPDVLGSKVELYNHLGQVVYSNKMQNDVLSIDVEQLKKGIYQIRVFSNTETYSKSIVIQ